MNYLQPLLIVFFSLTATSLFSADHIERLEQQDMPEKQIIIENNSDYQIYLYKNRYYNAAWYDFSLYNAADELVATVDAHTTSTITVTIPYTHSKQEQLYIKSSKNIKTKFKFSFYTTWTTILINIMNDQINMKVC